ncbi:uncharacterized protein LOC112458723 [Temnothorax curvispinosus]|uniref:Uncharacterized protein LOC112458723 n=1 Tax=Temnothorax curvispinosus TaxID=300111 RepID=A0A6J1QBV5_9HYME|nr:uncharacterized protein LOC112458723 [Temnothorax curvispinosus]
MSELLVQQQALLHSISRSLENFKKIGKNNYTAAKIRSRITSLKETWLQCVQVNAQLLQACPEDNRAAFDYFKHHQFDAIEDIYQGTLDYMVECLEEIEPPRTSDSGRVDLSSSAVGCVDAGTCRYAAHIEIHPIGRSHPGLTTMASILNSLTNYSPAPISPHNSWSHLADLTLADPDPMNSDPIDILIGADLYSELILDGVRKGSSGQPIAQNTILGWVLSGPMSTLPSSSRTITVQHCLSSLSLDRELQNFWEIEEVSRLTTLSPEDQQCEEHFLNTHSRCSNGRYVVRLPFKRGPPIDIGDSYHVAERCLKSLHRRLSNNVELKTEYTEFMREYERLGHMRQCPLSAPFSDQCVYIPHHAVIKDHSVTSHLRVVFNASSPSSNATSLNDHLLTGPKLQADLAAVLLRWRQFRYVYSADITKMYRQIQVDPRDIDYQRILWMDDNEIIQAYQLLTVTYGTASAPYLALRTLLQLCEDEGRDFALAVAILLENRFVDDALFGADDIPLLRQMRDQLCALLRRGQFELRKWSSN